jgi:NADH:ubiquinone oxidoreductase subunit 5 (subunit L)/multisubunit Na+/H+ antiporter MnhA subunit
MDSIPILLAAAVLLPLASFFVILVLGPSLGKGGRAAGYVSIGAIALAGVLSFTSLGFWLSEHWPEGHEEVQPAPIEEVAEDLGEGKAAVPGEPSPAAHPEEHHDDEHAHVPPYEADDYYLLGQFGDLRLSISYYIDALTIAMFCMVTLIATCIHVYATGYMHDELHDVTDHEAHLADGSHVHRPGRYHRFFQYLSLFCFSMLGLVLAGNILMVFVFWELVGICSYFLIGFYVERKSATNAANKAFIVNRVGDFGMIIGLMAIWSTLGTFAFEDVFEAVRPEAGGYHAQVPDEMVLAGAGERPAAIAASLGPDATEEEIAAAITAQAETEDWRSAGFGYWLWVVAGVGIFCGCVGKSAQFPLHVWLPDAMEGPTPVSALVHSATMVAAGVYLAARFYPFFAPEVLLVIAVIGMITLFMAATIAITATDIKRVLAYSTVSQLGYMMLAIGMGGWLAGVMHLITHAFFKSLLFLCSGSVIHAVHSNEMTEMGGLIKKMPWTAYTMLIGCLAIAGAGIPFVIGFSGYYSKDAILEQGHLFMTENPGWAGVFFWGAAGGAAITAFYMFRMWYMTFLGKPRNVHRYDHAHESPWAMVAPLAILSVFAVGVAWPIPGLNLTLLLEQARPAGTLFEMQGRMVNLTWPNEHLSHMDPHVTWATMIAFATALGGILLATVFYVWRPHLAGEVRQQYAPVHRFLVNKWWFDELYHGLFFRPTHVVSGMIARFDRNWIDWFVDGSARVTRRFAFAWERVADQTIVDGFVNLFAGWMYSLGLSSRRVQRGSLREYVLFIAVGLLVVFVLISVFRVSAVAGH